MLWRPLPFGPAMVNGKTLPEAALTAPHWVMRTYEGGFKVPALAEQARIVVARGRALAVPGLKPGWMVGYWFDYQGLFDRLELLPPDHPPHEGSSTLLRRPCIDLFAVARDPTGSRNLARDAKRLLTGGKPMTKARAEALFA